MKRNLKIKAGVIVAIILACIVGIIGIPKSGADIVNNFKKNIHLGLDLQGGVQLVLQVQLQDAFIATADSTIEQIKGDLRKNNIQISDDAITRTEPKTVEEADKVEIDIKGIPATQAADFRRLVGGSSYSQWTLNPVNAPSDWRLTVTPSAALEIRRTTVVATTNTIDRKINGLGLAETSVQPTGRDPNDAELLVQLPGVDDTTHIEEVLKTKGILEWDQVIEGPFSTPDEALAKHGGVRPLNTKIVPEDKKHSPTPRFWMVSSIPVVRGSDIMNASAGLGDTRGWETDFVLSQAAADRFEAYTTANIQKRAAIVVDGQAISVPTIEATIRDRGRITGEKDQQEAADLALSLNAPLLAGLVEIEHRKVGASLGADSIREGERAGIVGLIAVVLVMLVYYRKAGINATLALFLNAIILIAALSYFGATLTLPGIAGVILTIGMAVDSNVLIFERIREELRTGKAIVAAVDAGFSKAFLTIIDTHVTTVVSCLFLFIFGTGPVRGFAVTLVIGLVANVFTAVFVSKTIFDFELSGKKRLEALSI
jgi:preprotein translocase subunit SecD